MSPLSVVITFYEAGLHKGIVIDIFKAAHALAEGGAKKFSKHFSGILAASV